MLLQSGVPVKNVSRRIGHRDAATTLNVYVTRPTLPFRWCVPLARRLETRDPVTVTRALLGPLA